MMDVDRRGLARSGYRLSLATVALTVASFGLALLAVPNSGRNCSRDCVRYPFLGPVVADQFPGDYLWMFPAMVLMLVVVALAAMVHRWADPQRQSATLIGLCLTTLAAGILVTDYHLQVTVVQPSLDKGQVDGIALLTQYNPNGVFLALEELGYLLLGLALACTCSGFAGAHRASRVARIAPRIGLALTAVALGAVSAVHGFDRQDTFEVAVITLVWLELIVVGAAGAVVFRRSSAGRGTTTG